MSFCWRFSLPLSPTVSFTITLSARSFVLLDFLFAVRSGCQVWVCVGFWAFWVTAQRGTMLYSSAEHSLPSRWLFWILGRWKDFSFLSCVTLWHVLLRCVHLTHTQQKVNMRHDRGWFVWKWGWKCSYPSLNGYCAVCLLSWLKYNDLKQLMLKLAVAENNRCAQQASCPKAGIIIQVVSTCSDTGSVSP